MSHTRLPNPAEEDERPQAIDADPPEMAPEADSSAYVSLTSASFIGLLVTQFLGAVNDNAFRWLVIGIGKEYVPNQVNTILGVGTACFILPYLLFASHAGYLADRFSKRSVIVNCKVAEILIMGLGVLAIWYGAVWWLLAVVALMGSQSALFGPAKFGSIPELLAPGKISLANGLMGLVTVLATLTGMALGNLLSDWTRPLGTTHLWLTASVLLGVAICGWITSLWISPLPAANPRRVFPWNFVAQVFRDMRILASERAILRVALGIAFFWALAGLANLNVDQFAAEGGTSNQSQIVPMLIALVLGVGVGSVLAGYWSGGHVELGILPLGAAGMILSSALLFTLEGDLVDLANQWTAYYVWACFFLFMLGASAGMFDVPLASFLQHRSPPEHLGAILAASNFMTFTGMLLTSLVFVGLRWPLLDKTPLFSSRAIFLLCGVVTIPVLVYIVYTIPQSTIRFIVWLAGHTLYRIKVFGKDEHLPERGGALLVCNHVSWLDGVLVLLTSSRPVRMLVYAGNFRNRWLLKLANMWGAILIDRNPKSIKRALDTARQALIDGELVCIFPEGGITRTGQIQAFRPGLLRIVKGTGVPVVPIYIDELWGSVFSFDRGLFFWKWPRRIPYPISIYFGSPVEHPEEMHQVRQAVLQLGAYAVQQRARRMLPLPRKFVRQCKRRRFRTKVADSSGAELNGANLLMRTLVLRRLLLRSGLASEEKYVGLLLPPTVAAVVANMAVSVMGRVAVNLNYTVSSNVMNQCIAQCGIRRVLTSRKFMEKMNFELDVELVYLEDFKDRVTLVDKLSAALATYAVPSMLLEWMLGLHKLTSQDVLTVIFTSGSTGVPKGVMLTHANIGSNVEAIDQVMQLRSDDSLLGVVPFFHSLGFTVTLWAVMCLDLKAAYHFSPLDARQIGKLCEQYRATLLLATPTFLRTYLRRVTQEQFATLEVVVTGAERLPSELADTFEETFSLRPIEGYGATELSPLAAVNIPPSRSSKNFQKALKEGTVGRPVPGVTAKVVDLDSGLELGAGQTGMLYVKGPNVMLGYLDQPEKTAEVVQDGWYRTGDLAMIDDEGFVTICGRQSRFSKIGGEMVPHIQIEECLAAEIGADEEEGPQAVVTAVPHATKGERLVVVHRPLAKSPGDLCKALAAAGLPNIYIPSPDSFIEVAELPMLGTGKIDLKGIRTVAEERFGIPAE